MTFGARCLLVWVAAMIAIGILALAIGAPIVSFTELASDGKLTAWQILAFGATLTVFGFYSVMTDDPDSRSRYRYTGWILFGCGLLLMLRAIFDFLTA